MVRNLQGQPYDYLEKKGFRSFLLKGVSACEEKCRPQIGQVPPVWCRDALMPACRQNTTNPFCTSFCALKSENCDDLYVNYCQDPAHPERAEEDMCACFRPLSFYQTFYADLAKQILLPTPNTQPECSYPPCSAAIVKTSAAKNGTCPDILNCVSRIKVNNYGQITGDVKIIPTVNCGITYVNPTPSPSPSPNEGEEEANAPTPFYKETWFKVVMVGVAVIVLVLVGWGFSTPERGSSNQKN